MTVVTPNLVVSEPSVNAAVTAPTPWAVTNTDVARASPCNTLVATCETNAMNGEAIPIVITMTTNIRRMIG